ncbi:ATP-dependent helicase [Candidatus Microgenomates bacterium]|nr:ATP-dependent helicase [Candidatus Microgenomates bacterium]
MLDKKILNREQLEAVRHGEGPLLVIAGAGTGKTTVITERIKHLILEKNVLPAEVLALTFTDKASREMEERVDVALPYGYSQMWITTFHSFCDRILRSEAIHIGLNPGYKLMSEAETILFLRKNLFKFKLEYFRPLGNPNKFLGGMLQHFSRLKDEDVSPNEYLAWAQSQKSKLKSQKYNSKFKIDEQDLEKYLELANAYKTYEELKTREGVMDFADLISNTLKLFRTRKNILTDYQNKFKYILVDEFQDTNFAQNELAILLSGNKQNITVVGDDDQAIYRWRGAAVSNIIQFKKHFPKTKVIVLTQNYRSTQTILDSAYQLIQNNNPDRLEVKEKIDKKLIGVRKIKGEAPQFIYTDRVENEADEVVKRISNFKFQISNFKFSDVAILVRANNHAEPFIRAFERHKIPYQFLGPGQLFRQEEIKDLIAYLKVLYNFEDSVSLYRVLSMEHFGISARDISAMLNFARRQNLSLFETLERIAQVFVQDEVKEKCKQIVGMITRHLKRMRKDSAGQILYYFLEDTGLLKKIVAYKTKLDERRAQNMAKFFDKLKTYEVEHEDASVSAIVDWIDLSMQMGESPLAADLDWTNNNAVNILTIHSSKGLEFPIVFLVNLVAQRFPIRERSEQIPIPDSLIKEILPEGDYHLEEERRLFYVGMTRARDQLFLTAANYYGEGKRERKLSPFIYETVGEKAIEQSTMKQFNNGAINQLTLLEWKPVESEVRSQKLEVRSKLLINYLSYSQIDTFNVCPMHYKAKYILRIPVPQSSAQSFGTSIHASLRDFYQLLLQGNKATEKQLLEILTKNWINEGYSSKNHEAQTFKKGEEILKKFLRDAFDPKHLPISLEMPFQFSIGKQDNILRIGGKIDRIDKLSNGKIEILDYKTGTNLPDEKELDKNFQLTVYALAATEVKDPLLGKKPDEVVLSLYFLESGRKFTTTRTKEQLEAAKEKLFEIKEAISISDFVCSKSSICRICEFKMLCSSTA